MKERVRSRVTPRKVGEGSKLRKEPERDKEGFRRDCLGSIEKSVELHLSIFSGRSHSADQSEIVLSANWTTAVASTTEALEHQTARSSANKEKCREGIEERRVARESMKKRKRKGPRTEP